MDINNIKLGDKVRFKPGLQPIDNMYYIPVVFYKRRPILTVVSIAKTPSLEKLVSIRFRGKDNKELVEQVNNEFIFYENSRWDSLASLLEVCNSIIAYPDE